MSERLPTTDLRPPLFGVHLGSPCVCCDRMKPDPSPFPRFRLFRLPRPRWER